MLLWIPVPLLCPSPNRHLEHWCLNSQLPVPPLFKCKCCRPLQGDRSKYHETLSTNSSKWPDIVPTSLQMTRNGVRSLGDPSTFGIGIPSLAHSGLSLPPSIGEINAPRFTLKSEHSNNKLPSQDPIHEWWRMMRKRNVNLRESTCHVCSISSRHQC